jgi:hypothetical protein
MQIGMVLKSTSFDLENIRLTLARRLNVAAHLRPKYVAGFTLLLKQNFPEQNYVKETKQAEEPKQVLIDADTLAKLFSSILVI